MKRPVVIGLEVHLQLKTKTKLFCSCSTDYIGVAANSNVCPVCLGVPGTLPTLNDKAVELAARLGLGLQCAIEDGSDFFRKSYFYADLPKAYQITQFEKPIAVGGYLDIDTPAGVKRIRINHLHLEEDAGKLVHPTTDGRLSGASYSLVDCDRGGIPLTEIVSEPDMSSPAEAREYVVRLRQLARYLDVSDGEMESGSLRVDANISLSNPDGSLGTRVEIKNMNSLKALERAVEYEIARQGKVLDGGGSLVQETRLWDDGEGVTRSMRSKESAGDYRYYPETDLLPIRVTEEEIARFKRELPELPWEKRERYRTEFGLKGDEVYTLTEQREVALYFERVLAAGAPPARSSNWIRMEVMKILNEIGGDIVAFPVSPEALAQLVIRVERGDFSSTIAKDVLEAMAKKKINLDEAVKQCGGAGSKLTQEALDALITKIMEEQVDVVQTIRAGQDAKGTKVKFLQGLIMKETRGQVNPKDASEALLKLLEK